MFDINYPLLLLAVVIVLVLYKLWVWLKGLQY